MKKQTCENCGEELTTLEIKYGVGWCEDCLGVNPSYYD